MFLQFHCTDAIYGTQVLRKKKEKKNSQRNRWKGRVQLFSRLKQLNLDFCMQIATCVLDVQAPIRYYGNRGSNIHMWHHPKVCRLFKACPWGGQLWQIMCKRSKLIWRSVWKITQSLWDVPGHVSGLLNQPCYTTNRAQSAIRLIRNMYQLKDEVHLLGLHWLQWECAVLGRVWRVACIRTKIQLPYSENRSNPRGTICLLRYRWLMLRETSFAFRRWPSCRSMSPVSKTRCWQHGVGMACVGRHPGLPYAGYRWFQPAPTSPQNTNQSKTVL